MGDWVQLKVAPRNQMSGGLENRPRPSSSCSSSERSDSGSRTREARLLPGSPPAPTPYGSEDDTENEISQPQIALFELRDTRSHPVGFDGKSPKPRRRSIAGSDAYRFLQLPLGPVAPAGSQAPTFTEPRSAPFSRDQPPSESTPDAPEEVHTLPCALFRRTCRPRSAPAFLWLRRRGAVHGTDRKLPAQNRRGNRLEF